MEVDGDLISVSGKSISVPVFPPFFMQLPSELKLKILDSVSGVDIARVSCVCLELRYLVSSDDLWKQKYVMQFGNYNGSGTERSFKQRFAKAWEGRKMNGNGGSSFNVMRRNHFNPFGGDFGEDDKEWLNIVRLCLPGVGVPPHRNGVLLSNCNRDS